MIDGNGFEIVCDIAGHETLMKSLVREAGEDLLLAVYSLGMSAGISCLRCRKTLVAQMMCDEKSGDIFITLKEKPCTA